LRPAGIADDICAEIQPRVSLMQNAIQPPTAERVRAACNVFDQENELTEQALTELFRQYPQNNDARHVLIKVVAVNALYYTNIYALQAVASHIHLNHSEIDAALAAGSPDIVDKIAKIKVSGKIYNFFSFATKFCSWHNPLAYPIYDSHVDHYLWTLQKQDHFKGFLHPQLWDYPKFLEIMIAFKQTHGLTDFSFKEVDKFLFLEGAPPKSTVPTPEPGGPGAFDYYPAEELPN
jgi:hypothetical protein